MVPYIPRLTAPVRSFVPPPSTRRSEAHKRMQLIKAKYDGLRNKSSEAANSAMAKALQRLKEKKKMTELAEKAKDTFKPPHTPSFANSPFALTEPQKDKNMEKSEDNTPKTPNAPDERKEVEEPITIKTEPDIKQEPTEPTMPFRRQVPGVSPSGKVTKRVRFVTRPKIIGTSRPKVIGKS